MSSGRFWRKSTALEPLFRPPNCSGVFGITGDANGRNAVSGGVFRDAGREYRGRQALCAWVQGRQRTAGVKGQRPLGGYRAAAPVRSVEAASLYSGVQRWKTSAQGKLMPASTCTGYYLTQNSQDLRLRRPFPGPRTSSQEGGNLFETDTTQWTLRQAWHL